MMAHGKGYSSKTETSLPKDMPKLAAYLFAKGLEPIPIAPGQKYPTMKGWQNHPLPISPWPQGYGIGLRTGKLSAIDIDIYDDALVSCQA